MVPPGVPDPAVWGDRDPDAGPASPDEVAESAVGGRVRRRPVRAEGPTGERARLHPADRAGLHLLHGLRPRVPGLVHHHRLAHRARSRTCPPAPGERTQNVLDRFEIDWSLCMYCGICVEECPFDALAWEPQHTAAAPSAVLLRHGIDDLTGPPPT